MDSATRDSMLRRANAAIGLSDKVQTVQTGAERIREAFVNRPRRTIGQGPSMTELIAMSLARNACQAVESITFWCHLLIFSCPVCHYKKGVRKIFGVFMCTSCEDVCAAPIPRFGVEGSQEPAPLPLDISSLEETYHIMELKSHTYYDHGNYESFACSGIIQPVCGVKLGIVSIDAVGINPSGANNLSDVLPQVSQQLHITNIAHTCLKSSDPSLTELLFVVRKHLKL